MEWKRASRNGLKSTVYDKGVILWSCGKDDGLPTTGEPCGKNKVGPKPYVLHKIHFWWIQYVMIENETTKLQEEDVKWCYQSWYRGDLFNYNTKPRS